MQQDCRHCFAKGEITCTSCGGLGMVSKHHRLWQRKFTHRMSGSSCYHTFQSVCYACNGVGFVFYYPNRQLCLVCSGAGRKMQVFFFSFWTDYTMLKILQYNDLFFFFLPNSCLHCHRLGTITCDVCSGHKKVLVYINLVVKWSVWCLLALCVPFFPFFGQYWQLRAVTFWRWINYLSSQTNVTVLNVALHVFVSHDIWL